MISKILDVICGGKIPKCHESSLTELYRLEEKFHNALYPITQHLLSYLPHNIIASTEVKIVVKKRDFLDKLGHSYLCIYLHSLPRGKI